ncbi:hypothetical protein ACFYOK_29305 [Microbispora bryophytorum]|uniref:hypothetical protein n=1 Tax=Microbispora bryophytorum TaxID=1460882 RepID=UPI0033FA93D7
MPQPTKTASEPYEQQIPGGTLEPLESACAWVSTVIRSLEPDRVGLPELAARSARGLVSNALRATPTADKVLVRVLPLAKHIKVEVRHPGRPFALSDSWNYLDTEIVEFGSSGTHAGHNVWFLLPRAAE